MTWAAVKVALGRWGKKWWVWAFIILIAVCGYFFNQIKETVRIWATKFAYENPAEDIKALRTEIEGLKKDIHILETTREIRRPDGTVEITTTRETTDRSVETSTATEERREKKKPILATSRMLEHSLALSSGIEFQSPEASYTLRWKNLSGGITAPLDSSTEGDFRDGVRVKMGWSF